MAQVCVRYFAAAARAAGRDAETVDSPDLRSLHTQLCEAHGEPMARVLAAATLLVDGVVTHDAAYELQDGVTVDVLPPFAGG